MDTTGCPESYATDISFEPPTPYSQCSTYLPTFWGIVSTFAILRFIAFVKQTMNWRAVNKRQSRKGRLPVAPGLSLIFVFFYSLLLLLAGLNIVNVNNGVSFTLYSLAFIPYALTCSLILFRTVRLGAKIIPLSRDMGLVDRNLHKFGHVGKLLVAFQVFSIVLSSFALIVLSPIFPEQHDLLGKLGFAFKGAFQLTFNLGLIVQFQRCIRVIQKTEAATKDIQAAIPKEKKRNLSQATRAMRNRQIGSVISFFFAGGLFWLLTGKALPWSFFWVVSYIFGFETVTALIVEFFLVNAKRSDKRRNKAIAAPIVEVEKLPQIANDESPATPPSAPSSSVKLFSASSSQKDEQPNKNPKEVEN